MLKINFLKIKEFLSAENIPLTDLPKIIGVSIEFWEAERNADKSVGYLDVLANEFNVKKRIFLVNTLRIVVEDLIERSWENNKSIDRENILHGDIGELELTLAESVFLYEGCQTGIADCTLQNQDKYEYRGHKLKQNVIRPEIIEWLLNPSVCALLVKTSGITLIGAEIRSVYDPLFRPIRTHVNRELTRDRLNFTNAVIDKDLIFRDCIFALGVYFDNSSLQSLYFQRCSFKGVFSAVNIITVGDVWISPVEKEQALSKIDSDSATAFDVAGYLSFRNANINGGLYLYDLAISGEVSLKNVTADLLDISNFKTRNNLDLNGVNLKKSIHLDNIRVEGVTDADHLICETLICRKSVFFLSADFNFLRCHSAWFTGSHFLGNATSLALACSTVENLYLDEGFFALNGVTLFRSEIKSVLDCKRSIFGSGDFGQSLALQGSKIELLRLQESAYFGEVCMKGLKLNSLGSFQSSVYIACPEIMGAKALDAQNIESGKEISFKPDTESFTNPFGKLVRERAVLPIFEDEKAAKPEETSDEVKENQQSEDEIARELARLLYKRYPEPLQRLEFHHGQYFKAFDQFASNKEDYLETSTLVLGEASFENGEIKGRIDCAGTTFYNCYSLGKKREDKTTFKAIDDWMSGTILGRFVAFIYLLPLGLIQLFTRLSNWAYINLFLARKPVQQKIEQRRAKWANFLNVWLTPKHVEWPNALTLSHVRINGDLFLNKGPNGRYPAFRPIGEVDLHSAKIDNFFLTPDIGAEDFARWRIIGLKYDFIYSNDSQNESLEYCNWFFDYAHEDNFRQPYEQLAASYLKMGDDTNARKVLMRTPGRGVGEKILMAILSLIAYLSLPSYRALAWLGVLWFCGSTIFSQSVERKEIIKEDSTNTIKFSPNYYSFQLLIPFISAPQKDAFEPSYKPKTRAPWAIPYRPEWLWDKVPHKWYFDWVYLYHAVHSFLGTILISLFLLGIARIIRNT